jgi:hypothetical protein
MLLLLGREFGESSLYESVDHLKYFILDLTGDTLSADIAPTDSGVLFLPEPLYHRRLDGTVTSIGAITWCKGTVPDRDRVFWAICGWSDRDDPHDPSAAATRAQLAAAPGFARELGPYTLFDLALLPIAEPVPHRLTDRLAVDEPARNWQPAPDGRYCLQDHPNRPTKICTALAYAFWRIQAQPLAATTPAPLDRTTRRRATRASIVHQTRIVTLRRLTAATDTSQEPQWRYRVRFLVRGHWRHLHHPDGTPYRIWINAYIKGPDGAPLLAGETVSVLTR